MKELHLNWTVGLVTINNFKREKLRGMKKCGDNDAFEELSSPSMGLGSLNFGASNIFGGRKSSFEMVNMIPSEMKASCESQKLPLNQYRNSLDILASNIYRGPQTQAPQKNIIQIYNQHNKLKIQEQGVKALQIGEVQSESEGQYEVKQQDMNDADNKFGSMRNSGNSKLKAVLADVKFNYHSYFPQDLADVLKERQIPLQYVKGMLLVRDQKQIKTTRRLKVERYLQKRRKKTWNRKICYNCRQKVAEERLRIKGKFIKKRRAMEILGLTIPIQTSLLKQRLYAALKDKDNQQIMEIINAGRRVNGQNQSSSFEQKQEMIDEADEADEVDQDQE